MLKLEAGGGNIIALDENGLPFIVYHEDLNRELKLFSPTLGQAQITLDHHTGQPGSVFSLSGSDLPPNSAGTIFINDTPRVPNNLGDPLALHISQILLHVYLVQTMLQLQYLPVK